MESSEQILKIKPLTIQISEENEIKKMKVYKLIPVKLVDIANIQRGEREVSTYDKALAKKISEYIKVPKYRKRGRKTSDNKPPKTAAQRQRERRARIRMQRLELESKSETEQKGENFSQDKFQNKSTDTIKLVNSGNSSSCEVEPSAIAIHEEYKKLRDDKEPRKMIDIVEPHEIEGKRVSQNDKPTKTCTSGPEEYDDCKHPRLSKKTSTIQAEQQRTYKARRRTENRAQLKSSKSDDLNLVASNDTLSTPSFDCPNSSVNSVISIIIKEQSTLKFILPKYQPRDPSFLTNSATKKQKTLHQSLPTNLNPVCLNLDNTINNHLADRNENIKLPVAAPISMTTQNPNAIDNFSMNKEESLTSEPSPIVRFFSSSTLSKNIPIIRRVRPAVDEKKLVSDSLLESKMLIEKKSTKSGILQDCLSVNPKQNLISLTHSPATRLMSPSAPSRSNGNISSFKKSPLVCHKEPPSLILSTSTNYSSPRLSDDSTLEQPPFFQCKLKPIFLISSAPSIRTSNFGADASLPNASLLKYRSESPIDEEESFATLPDIDGSVLTSTINHKKDLWLRIVNLSPSEDDHVESILPDILES